METEGKQKPVVQEEIKKKVLKQQEADTALKI